MVDKVLLGDNWDKGLLGDDRIDRLTSLLKRKDLKTEMDKQGQEMIYWGD